MGFKYINRPRGGSARAFDADVLAWQSAVVANGGSVSLARLIIVDQFVFSEKASGCWALTDDYLGLWAENSAQALTSLKQRRLATAINSPVFTVDRDYTFNGSTSYVNSGFVPSTHALAMVTNSIHAEVYERTNTTGATDTMGSLDTSSRTILIQARSGGSMNGTGNSNAGAFTLGTANSQGLSQVGRSGATTGDQYGAKNGVDLVTATPPTVLGASLPTLSFFIGGSNNGSLVRARTCSVGYVAWGAALNGIQRLARYNNVQAWATSVGAQV